MTFDPAAILPQLQRAQAMLQAGQSGQAWLALAPLRPAIDRDGQALRLYALAAQAIGRIDDAIAALKRIAALEGGPAEILGAIADTYGRDGRHAEAHDHWTVMVQRHPGIVDAHLNRAVSASQAGLYEAAIAAADAGLKRFAAEPRLLATKAMALKNAGRHAESVALFEQAVAADPNRALTRHNQAVALRAHYRFEEACEAYAEAERLGLRGPQFRANWAAAALEAGRVEQAADLYRQALAEDPAHQESLNGLTRLHIEYRTGADPFGHYANLARMRKDDPESWLAWANALAVNRRYGEAARVAAEGLGHHPRNPSLPIARAFSQGMDGDPLPAVRQLEKWYRENPDNEALWATLSQLGLRAGMPALAAETAERLTDRYPYHQTAWSILSLAWRLLDDPREHWLCNYDQLVMTVEVEPTDKIGTPIDYARRIANVLAPLHNALDAPGDQSLREGTQTGGALFDNPDPAVQDFRKAISEAARRALSSLPNDARHPFLARKATRFTFSGSWSVRLRPGGGHHVPHFHSEGWMSSAYYAVLPDLDAKARDRHEGWIEFGRPPPIFNLDLPPRRIVEPKEGLLVLFPSYMWHGTIPFQSGDRMTAAFDYLPAV